MGQCFTKQDVCAETNPLSPLRIRISQVLPNSPKRRLKRTRSEIIIDPILNSKP